MKRLFAKLFNRFCNKGNKRFCENCGIKFIGRKIDIQKGWARFCSKDCANEAQRKNFGMKKAKRYFAEYEGIWVRYWRDENTGKKEIEPEARWIWEMNYGPIPEGMCISHKDGDRCNSKLQNLELVTMLDVKKKQQKNYMTVNGTLFKYCPKCNQWLSIENFKIHHKIGYQSYCISCAKKDGKERREKQKVLNGTLR